MTIIDESQFVHQPDLQAVYAHTDPVAQEAVICSITTYRAPNKLNEGDVMPHLELTSLAEKQPVDLRTLYADQPLVLFFGSYT